MNTDVFTFSYPSIRTMIGQKLVVGFHGTHVSEEFLSFLAEYKIGNIILFERNIQNDVQLKELTKIL